MHSARVLFAGFPGLLPALAASSSSARRVFFQRRNGLKWQYSAKARVPLRKIRIGNALRCNNLGMDIRFTDTDNGGIFRSVEDQNETGRLIFEDGGNQVIVATHTIVNPDYSGQGIGKELVKSLISHARDNDLKIKAVCPFVVSYFDKNPDEVKDITA